MKKYVFYLMSLSMMMSEGGISDISAEPVVIFDNGRTESMQMYLPQVKRPSNNMLLQSTVMSRKRRLKPSAILPVRTPELTPGKVTPRKIKSYLSTPFFIVGADPLSNQWLIHHREQLNKLNAIGMAVNVQTQAQLSLLQKSAGGIHIAPIRGGDLAKKLRLTHYPVLVSGKLIEQ